MANELKARGLTVSPAGVRGVWARHDLHTRAEEFESEGPGSRGAQDTFYVGTLKGVGRIYQQAVIDTYKKVGVAKLYTEKTPVTAADLLNDRVIPFFDEQRIPLQRVLTDLGAAFCGTQDKHAHAALRAATSCPVHPPSWLVGVKPTSPQRPDGARAGPARAGLGRPVTPLPGTRASRLGDHHSRNRAFRPARIRFACG